MKPICSCLIPTRNRPEQFAAVCKSIRSTSNGNDVEIYARLDNDEPQFEKYRDSFIEYDCRYAIGDRMNAYMSHGDFYDEVARLASGVWVALFNDDTLIEGEGWDEKLNAIPTVGFIVQPAVSMLNESRYEHAEGQAVPFLPNGCWRFYGVDKIPYQPDVNLNELLKRNGWSTRFLEGVTIRHQRATDEELQEHRKV